MKVLIITYYWPPSGGSGVQRWLKFVKYLPDFEITPIVYTPENPNYRTIDNNLDSVDIEIIKKPIFSPENIIAKKKNTTGVANLSKGGVLSWIRGNFFIPDAKIFWINPSVRFLTNYIKKEKIDVIISSGPPHSMHLIAQKIKLKTNVKWIADFRDSWTNLYYTKNFNLSTYAKNKNRKLELKVRKNADLIIATSKSTAKELSENSNKTTVITNGYDNEALTKVKYLDKKFSICHIGLLPRQSNPLVLWKTLAEICEENKTFKNDLKIALTGNVASEILDSIKKNLLENNLQLTPYVTHHKAIELQKKAQVLLLLVPDVEHSKGILPGKFFEYITSNRPILAISDTKSDVAQIITETNTGNTFSFQDKKQLKKEILRLYALYRSENLKINPKNIARYHRKELTKKLANHIKQLTL